MASDPFFVCFLFAGGVNRFGGLGGALHRLAQVAGQLRKEFADKHTSGSDPPALFGVRVAQMDACRHRLVPPSW
jgi:hypothetical protein